METAQQNQQLQISRDQQQNTANNWQSTHPQQVGPITGKITNFIQNFQKLSRQLSPYQTISEEHPNWQPIACHFRNKQYNDNNTRTPGTLQQCLKFILKEFIPVLMEDFGDRTKRINVLEFMHNRIVAIRREYFVQEIFQPVEMSKIIRVLIVIQVLLERPVKIIGLDEFLDPKNIPMLTSTQKNKQAYLQILKITLYWSKANQFQNILKDHIDQIQQDNQLTKILKTKTKILNSSYHTYFKTLASNKTDFIHRCLLWTQIQSIRKLYTNLMVAANMNESMVFVCKVLGLRKKEGWINLREEKKKGFGGIQELKSNFDVPIKIWVSQREILEGIEKLGMMGQQ